MQKNKRLLRKICLVIVALMVTVPLKARESVYDRLLGIAPYPAIFYEEESPSLNISLHSRYDKFISHKG
jgi:hypothetical protein